MSSVPAPTLSVLLRRARRAAGWTQAELAGRAGISEDTISVLERGRTRAPHRETLTLLAEALRLAPEEWEQWARALQGMRLPGAAAPARNGRLGGDYSCEGGVPGPLGGTIQVPEEVPLADPPQIIRRPLPTPATPLIGREQEVRALCALLQRPEVRLLTVTGGTGVGKTRLALQVAAEVGAVLAQGVQFVSLAALNDPGLVLPTIAQALGLRAMDPLPVLDLLASALREQQMLLVLDNFEQVSPAAPHLALLLEACAGVKLLVTSREVLRLRAEQQFRTPPLALPPLPPRTGLQPSDIPMLEANSAVQLFLQRAQSVQRDFQLTPSNAGAITAICHRLEGIPLAIELAAPRLKLLSPQDLLARLDWQLPVLTGGARDLPERQRTMRATIAWSYDLLSSAEQALFGRLAVFAGGWTLAAAEQVCAGTGVAEWDLLEGLSALLDKSLLYQEYDRNRAWRFRMLAVLREFGLEQLEAAGEAMLTRQAHAVYYAALVEEPASSLQGAWPPSWRDWLAVEHDNLAAALDWWLAQAEQDKAAAERALRLWCVLSPFWLESCYRTGYASVPRGLAVRAGLDAPGQVKALLDAATVLRAVGEGARAATLVQEALSLAQEVGDQPSVASAMRSLEGGTGS